VLEALSGHQLVVETGPLVCKALILQENPLPGHFSSQVFCVALRNNNSATTSKSQHDLLYCIQYEIYLRLVQSKGLSNPSMVWRAHVYGRHWRQFVTQDYFSDVAVPHCIR